MSVQWIFPIIATLIASFFTYLGIVRKTSGRIATSEADQVWEEAASLRDVYRDDNAKMREEIRVLTAEVIALRVENAKLKRDPENHASI